MTDYNAILDTQIEPDAPLTAVLAAQWRDNPIAMMEGADTAPRLATKTAGGRIGASSNLTFTGLNQFQGLWFYAIADVTTAPGEITITASDSASGAFYGAVTFEMDTGPIFGFVDFSTGLVKMIGGTSVTFNYQTATMTGASNAISRLRFATNANALFSTMVWANGGESAT